MPSAQEQFDEAMFHFSMAHYDTAIAQLLKLIESHPDDFDARLALGMAYYRKGDFASAIAEGHKAELLRPKEQLVHTNLSLFYMKAGDKQKAEHHGLQARIASWRESAPASGSQEHPAAPADPDLQLARPAPAPVKITGRLPETPWKKAAHSPLPTKPPPDPTPSQPPPAKSD